MIPIVSLIIFLAFAVFLYGADATGGPVQMAFLLCTLIAGAVGLKNGHRSYLFQFNQAAYSSGRFSSVVLF